MSHNTDNIRTEERIGCAAKCPKIGDHTHTVITVGENGIDIDILTIGINKATGIAIGCDQMGGLYFDCVSTGARLDSAEWGWVWANGGVAGLPAQSRIGISPDMIELGIRHTEQYRAEAATPTPELAALAEQNQNNKNDCENNQKNAAAIEKTQCDAAGSPVAAPSTAVGRPKIYPNGVQPATAWRPKTPAIRAKYDALGGSRWLNEHLAALVQQDADTMAKNNFKNFHQID